MYVSVIAKKYNVFLAKHALGVLVSFSIRYIRTIASYSLKNRAFFDCHRVFMSKVLFDYFYPILTGPKLTLVTLS